MTDHSHNGANGSHRSQHLQEDTLLLDVPVSPLIPPSAPVPREVVTQQERALPSDYTRTDPWRVMRILGELITGFNTLSHIPPSVSIFGSARTSPAAPEYGAAVETARLLAEAGFGIITGGGPGIMEAANKGAQVGKNCSIGCTIELASWEPPNRFIDLSLGFCYFFVRKTMFIKYSHAFVIFPGGFGTSDELFDALNLIQNRKISHFPVILFGSRYWGGLVNWIRATMLASENISPQDMDLLRVSDDPEEVCRIVVSAYQEYYRLRCDGADAHRDQSIR